jgi:hypothetical protein
MVIVLASTIIACEKEADSSTNSNPLIGTWEAISNHRVQTENGQIIVDSNEFYSANEFVITFNSNGTATSTSFGVDMEASPYIYSGGNQLILIDDNDINGPDSAVYNITLTNTDLKLFQQYPDDTIQGIVYSESYEINFKKK